MTVVQVTTVVYTAFVVFGVLCGLLVALALGTGWNKYG